jgi:hypothetical protein
MESHESPQHETPEQREQESQASPDTKFDERIAEEEEHRRVLAERLKDDPSVEPTDDDPA